MKGKKVKKAKESKGIHRENWTGATDRFFGTFLQRCFGFLLLAEPQPFLPGFEQEKKPVKIL